MNRPIPATALGLLLFTLAGTFYTTAVSADAGSDCRQEALDYDIPAEQKDDYVIGCLASRGELVVDSSASMDNATPAETEAMAGDSNATE